MEQETTQPTTKKSISTGASIITAAVILALALIIIWGPHANKPDNTAAPTEPAVVTSVPAEVATIRPTDRIRGDASKATIAIIEYSDSDCSFCARFHPTLTELFTEYNGTVAWVYRYFPLTSLHPNALQEAVALECVAELGGNSAFNKYLDTIINVTLSPDEKGKEVLTTFATAQGINKNAFTQCTEGKRAADRVTADTEEAQKIGAQGTPFSIIVNLKTGEQKIIPGAYPIEEVRKNIDSLLRII